MTEKPNCGNCSGNETPNLTDFVNCNIRKDTVPFNPCCVMNPGARECLIAPVIKELNQREHNIGMYPCALESGKIHGYNEAIALIKNGVGGK